MALSTQPTPNITSLLRWTNLEPSAKVITSGLSYYISKRPQQPRFCCWVNVDRGCFLQYCLLYFMPSLSCLSFTQSYFPNIFSPSFLSLYFEVLIETGRPYTY